MSQPPPRPLHQVDTSDGATGTWAGVAPNLRWAATSAPAPRTDVSSTPEGFHAISQKLMAAPPCETDAVCVRATARQRSLRSRSTGGSLVAIRQ